MNPKRPLIVPPIESNTKGFWRMIWGESGVGIVFAWKATKPRGITFTPSRGCEQRNRRCAFQKISCISTPIAYCVSKSVVFSNPIPIPSFRLLQNDANCSGLVLEGLTFGETSDLYLIQCRSFIRPAHGEVKIAGLRPVKPRPKVIGDELHIHTDTFQIA